MTTKKPTKRALSPRSAKRVGRKPAPKGAKASTRPTKADQLVALLRQRGGVSIVELTGALGVLPHTARAQISVEKRKRGLTIELKDGRYRIV